MKECDSVKICIDCAPEELRELFDKPKCKTVASNSEITNSIRDAVYQAMFQELLTEKQANCDIPVSKK